MYSKIEKCNNDFIKKLEDYKKLEITDILKKREIVQEVNKKYDVISAEVTQWNVIFYINEKLNSKLRELKNRTIPLFYRT